MAFVSGASTNITSALPRLGCRARLPALFLALLLCGVGLIAKQQFKPAAWCSTNRDIECSIWTIGWIMLLKVAASPARAVAAVLTLSESVAPNWG